MYVQTKNEVSTQRLSKVRARTAQTYTPTDTQAEVTKCIITATLMGGNKLCNADGTSSSHIIQSCNKQF